MAEPAPDQPINTTSKNHARPRREATRSHFVAQLSSFVGREREIREICDLIVRPDVRLVTLTGPGGAGKTRLAVEIAHRLQPSFDAGVTMVSLAPIRDPYRVLDEIAFELGVKTSDAKDTLDQIVEALHDRELILLLDNFEQVAAAGPVISDLLRSCSRLKALVTSRTVLHLTGEQQVAVRALSLPEQDASTINAIESAASVQLFMQRAHAIDHTFTLTNTNAAAINAICHRVDGLPLAIELAAARIAHLSVHQIRERLAEVLPLLIGGARDQPPRQQTMRATIAWSYELLTDVERALFCKLSVLVGKFTIETAAAITGESIDALLDGISSLTDKSLLVLDDVNAADTRFGMLETVREFGADQLRLTLDEFATRKRHAAWFADMAELTASGFYRDAQPDEHNLSSEMPDMLAAANWAGANGIPEFAVRIAISTRSFIYRFRPNEALQWLESALDDAAVPLPTRADALWAASMIVINYDPSRGKRLAEESRVIAASLGDVLREVKALNVCAVAAEWSREFEDAARINEEGLAMLAGIGDEPDYKWIRALFQCNLADSYLWRHDPESALPLAERALATWREIHLPWAISFGLQTIAAAECMTGNVAAAARDYEEALALRLSIDDQKGIAGLVEGFAGIAVELGRSADAARMLGIAHAVRDRKGAVHGPHWLRGEQVRAIVESRITQSAFARCWSEGLDMTLPDGVDMAREIARMALASDQPDSSPWSLTPRELDVLHLVALGRTNTEIGAELFISHRTAQTHITNILGKLGATTRTEAATIAVREGIVALD